MTHPLLIAIWVPILAGLVLWMVPRAAAVVVKALAVLVALFTAAWVVLVWAAPEVLTGGETLGQVIVPAWDVMGDWGELKRPLFMADAMSGFAGAAAGVLGFLMVLYAAGFSREEETPARRLFSGMLISIGAALGTLYAENIIVLGVFWGLIGIPFFLLLAMGGKAATGAAKKAFIIVGGTDSLLILGLAMVWLMSGGRMALHSLGGPYATGGRLLATAAYVCLFLAAIAKAGAIPLHSWIPDAAATAPVPAVALLPAALDKVLGIYLLARISLTVFDTTGYVSTLVMVIGAVTVLAAAFMALVQHDLRRLLGFHAVSQVGYMLLGIGTGTFVGIAGGIFHMINNTIYKSCLFLGAGTAERKAGTGDLARMGGLAKALPVSFAASLVAALAISGVPPLNGFVSKWMVYQGVVETGRAGGGLWVLLLAAAVFGSALTLASFVKVIYSVYLAPRPAGDDEKRAPACAAEAATARRRPEGGGENVLTAIPMIALALACVVFGVVAYHLPLNGAIFPAVEGAGVAPVAPEEWAGLWRPTTATVLILVGIVAGFLIYLLGTATKPREDAAYTGGEDSADLQFWGPDFYETVTRIPPFTTLYERAAKGLYDVYNWGRGLAGYAGKFLGSAHSGLLYRYATWLVAGVVVLLWVFLR
ncbi:MAG: complex I subunit 5 family protein [Planctomycetota bacterium]|jgi:formate hydrogenlyase subunit 3/multisubunit Na+/H+ antiporter MnhD subunit